MPEPAYRDSSTLSLHDALPISNPRVRNRRSRRGPGGSQCTNGSSVCGSSGNQRLGVVTKTRSATRQSSATNCRCPSRPPRSEEHTSELQSLRHLVCRLLLEKKK